MREREQEQEEKGITNSSPLSVQVPFELPVQITVQLLLELEANLLDQNVNELEFELSKM